MKYTAQLIVAVLLVGCKVQIDQPTNVPVPSSTASGSAPAAGTTSASPAAPQTSSSNGATTGANSSTAASKSGSTDGAPTLADLEKQPGYNKDRIYQLSQLKTANLTINGHELTAWIADTDSKRDEGLMFVKDGDIKPDQGMLFVFPIAKEQGFWMKHTYIPLDIAYIGKDKSVVSTATMKPFDETTTPSHGPAMYVLEMKVGTLQRLGIQKGTQIAIPAGIVAQDLPPQGPPGMPGGG